MFIKYRGFTGLIGYFVNHPLYTPPGIIMTVFRPALPMCANVRLFVLAFGSTQIGLGLFGFMVFHLLYVTSFLE